MNIKVLFGQKVRSIRTERGISQEELAFRCELHRTYISDVERGERNVSLENIEKIATALGVEPRDLLDFDSIVKQGEGSAMKVTKVYMTQEAKEMLQTEPLAKQAYDEVCISISSAVWPRTANMFTVNNSEKNINGVVPLKENCYVMLEEKYNWFREKPLDVLKLEKAKGGPIDVYKEFGDGTRTLRAGLEFETGNISSAHRSMQKLMLGLNRKELDLAMILMPVHELAYYLTDRCANYEELEPYFENAKGKPFIFIGFNAEAYSPDVEVIPKGRDGMSKRSIKKWKPAE